MQTIELLKPHRHAGRDYPAGARISLPAHKAAWLQGLGVAQPAPATAPTPAPAAEAPTTKGKHKE